MYVVGVGTNVLLVHIFELFRLPKDEPKKKKLYIRNIYCWLVSFFFGSGISDLITAVAKTTSGRLRPYFLDICKPYIMINNGTGSPTGKSWSQYCNLPLTDKYAYITNYNCDGDSFDQQDARMSFMSGHSSNAAYAATFAIVSCQLSIYQI